MTRFDFTNRVAVVTGAGGGIGRAIARSLADRRCDLALADIDEDALKQTAEIIGNKARVTQHRLDVANSAAIVAFRAEVERDHGRVDVLVNNAGVALGGTFQETSVDEFDWLIAINFQGVVSMTRAFLPLLEASDQAQLVNLSSLFGLIAPPGQVAYSASKFAVRGFSEALRKELELAGSSVGVTVVHPGGVKTSIAHNARRATGESDEDQAKRAELEKYLRLSPERAGEIIVEAIIRRRPRVLVGADAKFMSLIERLLPVSYWSLIRRGFMR